MSNPLVYPPPQKCFASHPSDLSAASDPSPLSPHPPIMTNYDQF